MENWNDKVLEEEVEQLNIEELNEVEALLNRLISAWQIQNLQGIKYRFHDDQHIGDVRMELYADQHQGLDYQKILDDRMQELVESLEGNTLIHPPMTPIIEINESDTKARDVFTSLGYEGLSVIREEPMAIWSSGYLPGVQVKQNGEWRVLSGVWQRTIKAQMEKGWVNDMQRSNCKPPLTKEEDRNFLGRYAYHKNRSRQYVPTPPDKNTWKKYPDELDLNWIHENEL